VAGRDVDNPVDNIVDNRMDKEFAVGWKMGGYVVDSLWVIWCRLLGKGEIGYGDGKTDGGYVVDKVVNNIMDNFVYNLMDKSV